MRAQAKALARGLVGATMRIAPLRRRVREVALAGRLPKSVWKRLPVTSDFTVELPGGGSFVYRTGPGDGIARALYWRGIHDWEAATIAPFLRLARVSSHFLDIGANTGIYTLLACAVNPSIAAVAYEPVPRIYQRLVDNLRLNGLTGRCTARNAAVSKRRERVMLHVPYSLLPTSSSLHPEGFRGVPGELVEVASTTADLDTEGGPPVDLVKIDVEGFEDQVLEGMARILASDRPVIVCECNPDGPFQAVETLAGASGYTFFHLRAPAPLASAHIVPDPGESHRNYLLVPAERAAHVAALIRPDGPGLARDGRGHAEP